MKRSILMTLLLCCGIGGWADNKITLSNVQGVAGTEVTVSISMINSDVVSALQLSIPLGDNLTFVENSQQAGSRLSGHTLSAGVSEGILNIMVFSASMAAISGNEGEVCSFKLQLGNNLGAKSLNPQKTALMDTSGSLLTVSVSAGTVETRGAKLQMNNNSLNFGRVAINSNSRQYVRVNNVGNEPLVITNISFSSTIFSTTSTLPLTINAGSSQSFYVSCSPLVRGIENEEMVITSNSITGQKTIGLNVIPYGTNELTLGEASGSSEDEVDISVSMKNYDAISGFHMEIQMPDKLEYVDGSFKLSNRKQDHAATAYITDGILNVVAYSPTDKNFTGSNGEVGSFKVKIVGSSSAFIDIKKAQMVTTIDGKTTDVLSRKYGCTVSVNSPDISSASSIDFGRFSVDDNNVQKAYVIQNRGTAPLVINNINFANEQFSVSETFPITIQPSSSKSIVVVCLPTEAGVVNTNMEIFSNDPNKRLYVVNVSGNIFNPNYLTGSIVAMRDEVSLDISLNNYSNIYGIQFDIDSSEMFPISEKDVILTERGNELSVSIEPVSDRKLRVVAYCPNGQFISKGEGRVMTIKLIPEELLQDGAYFVKLCNIMLSSTSMKNIYAGDEISFTFGIGDPVILTANSYTRVYGDDNPAFGYTTSGADLVGVPKITCVATKTSPVGTYPIVIKRGTVANYNSSYVNGTLTITKAPLKIKAGTYTRKQGEDNPEFVLEYDGFKNGETAAVLTKQPTVTCNATKESALGDYEVKVSGAKAQNYEILYTNGVLKVTEADAIILTANSYTRVYGDDNPAFGYTTSGADLVGIPEISCVATKTSPAGTYPIIIKKGTVGNYNDSYVNGTLTITKAPLKIKAGTYTRKQGDDNPEFVLEYEGFKNGETAAVLTKQATVTCNATKESALGDYEVKVSGAKAQNYEILYTNGVLNVTEADAIILTANSYTRVYGDDNPAFGYTTSGTDLVGIPEISCVATKTSPAGTYPIIIKKGTVGNYNDSYVNGTLTITKAPLKIKAGTYTRKQGDVNPEFTLAYDGFKNGETAAVLTKQASVTCNATKVSALGDYEVKVYGAEAQNYKIDYTNGVLKVTEADAIILTANSYTRVYGDDNPAFGYTTSGADLVGVPKITCVATKTSPVGTYPIIIKRGTVANYNSSYVNGTLTITKAPLKIKARTYTRKQGEANPEFVLEYEGFKNGETNAVLTKRAVLTCNATKESAVGDYEVKVSGAKAQNYEILYTNGVLNVTEADAIILTANSYTRVYGDDNPAFGYTTSGTDLVGIPEISCVATKTSPAGTYPIIIKKGTVGNYNDSYVNGTLTITKAPLKIKAGTYTRKQGDDNPEFTLTYDGFKNGETAAVLTKQAVVTCNATKESALGDYEVKVSGAKAQNYEILYTNGVLNVTEADAIVLTANSYTRVYGDDNPAFGYTTSGADLVGIPEISCVATKTSPVGTYPIIIKRGTVSNYNDSYVNGTLTITKAPLKIKAGTYTRMRGEDNPQFTLSYEGFKNGETEAVLTKKPVVTTTATKESAVGDYSVKVSGAKAMNYEILYVNGSLIVETCLGDANGDGLVNAADVVAVVSHINGKTPTGFVMKAADANKDQTVDDLDVEAIANIIMKLIGDIETEGEQPDETIEGNPSGVEDF